MSTNRSIAHGIQWTLWIRSWSSENRIGPIPRLWQGVPIREPSRQTIDDRSPPASGEIHSFRMSGRPSSKRSAKPARRSCRNAKDSFKRGSVQARSDNSGHGPAAVSRGLHFRCANARPGGFGPDLQQVPCFAAAGHAEQVDRLFAVEVLLHIAPCPPPPECSVLKASMGLPWLLDRAQPGGLKEPNSRIQRRMCSPGHSSWLAVEAEASVLRRWRCQSRVPRHSGTDSQMRSLAKHG